MVPTGSVMVPTGSVMVPTGSVMVPTGSVMVPTGSVMVPTGSVMVPTGSVMVPTGSVMVPTGSVIVTPGSVIMVPPGSVIVTPGSVIVVAEIVADSVVIYLDYLIVVFDQDQEFTKGVSTQIEVISASDAESMWNILASIIKDAAKDSLCVAIGTLKTHTARREFWWLCEEVQSKVTVKQASLADYSRVGKVTVYQCLEGGVIDVLQSYIDEDKGESFYTVSWARDADGVPLLVAGGVNGIIRSFVGHGDSVNEIRTQALRPSLVLSASKDESVRLWNVETGICILIFAGAGGHRNEVLSVDFHSSDYNSIAVAILSSFIAIELLAEFWTYVERSFTWEGLPSQFPTKYVQFPVLLASIHTNYVDCCRWLGDFMLSKVLQGTGKGNLVLDGRVAPYSPLATRLSHVQSKSPIRQTAMSFDGRYKRLTVFLVYNAYQLIASINIILPISDQFDLHISAQFSVAVKMALFGVGIQLQPPSLIPE
ncbi:polycomb group protein fertilization-independent endosperm [Tanacetum coccineum]